MKIVKCSGCDRLIHADKVCLFCGNTKGFIDVAEAEVHENSKYSFDMAEMMVSQSHFSEAEEALSEVMKWSPNSSEVHWLRLLARAGCKSDSELFLSGFSFTESPDYDTAVRYASEDEKKVYLAVSAACSTLKKTLYDMISARNDAVKKKLQLPETLKDMQRFIEGKRAAVINSWQELRKCEQEIKLQENEGLVSISEYTKSTTDIRSAAKQKRESLEETFELNQREYLFHKFQLDSMKTTIETAKGEYYKLKTEHPSVAASAALIEKRDGIKNNIYTELESIKEYGAKMEELIERMNKVFNASREILELVESGEFARVKETIGKENFDYAVKYALSRI